MSEQLFFLRLPKRNGEKKSRCEVDEGFLCFLLLFSHTVSQKWH